MDLWRLVLCIAGTVGSGLSFDNMNGEYVISCTPNAPGCNDKVSTKWSEYPGGPLEYFEVGHQRGGVSADLTVQAYVGPITSLYSQAIYCFPGLPEHCWDTLLDST